MANDDEEGGNGSLHSRLVLELPADGRYRVSVTTFRPGETGRYSLAAAPAAADAQITRVEPATPIQLGQSRRPAASRAGRARATSAIASRRAAASGCGSTPAPRRSTRS